MINGYTAFTNHRACHLLQAFAPAEDMDGAKAIKIWLPPAKELLLQIATPHDPIRSTWMCEWDEAREDFKAL